MNSGNRCIIFHSSRLIKIATAGFDNGMHNIFRPLDQMNNRSSIDQCATMHVVWNFRLLINSVTLFCNILDPINLKEKKNAGLPSQNYLYFKWARVHTLSILKGGEFPMTLLPSAIIGYKHWQYEQVMNYPFETLLRPCCFQLPAKAHEENQIYRCLSYISWQEKEEKELQTCGTLSSAQLPNNEKKGPKKSGGVTRVSK